MACVRLCVCTEVSIEPHTAREAEIRQEQGQQQRTENRERRDGRWVLCWGMRFISTVIARAKARAKRKRQRNANVCQRRERVMAKGGLVVKMLRVVEARRIEMWLGRVAVPFTVPRTVRRVSSERVWGYEYRLNSQRKRRTQVPPQAERNARPRTERGATWHNYNFNAVHCPLRFAAFVIRGFGPPGRAGASHRRRPDQDHDRIARPISQIAFRFQNQNLKT
jgi:hypothetical protein